MNCKLINRQTGNKKCAGKVNKSANNNPINSQKKMLLPMLVKKIKYMNRQQKKCHQKIVNKK